MRNPLSISPNSTYLYPESPNSAPDGRSKDGIFTSFVQDGQIRMLSVVSWKLLVVET